MENILFTKYWFRRVKVNQKVLMSLQRKRSTKIITRWIYNPRVKSQRRRVCNELTNKSRSTETDEIKTNVSHKTGNAHGSVPSGCIVKVSCVGGGPLSWALIFVVYGPLTSCKNRQFTVLHFWEQAISKFSPQIFLLKILFSHVSGGLTAILTPEYLK